MPYLDVMAVEIGRTTLGIFLGEGSANIGVRIAAPEPPTTWSWIFRTPEPVLRGGVTQFDLCSTCGDLEVRTTVQPVTGAVAVQRDAERDRWVATYTHHPVTEYTGDSFGVEIGSRNAEGVFSAVDATRVIMLIGSPVQ